MMHQAQQKQSKTQQQKESKPQQAEVAKRLISPDQTHHWGDYQARSGTQYSLAQAAKRKATES